MAKIIMTFMVDPLMKAMILQTANDMGTSQGWIIRTALQEFFDGGRLSPAAHKRLAKFRERMDDGQDAENG